MQVLPYWPLNARPLGTNFFLNFWSSGPGKKRPGNMGPGKIKGRVKWDRAKLKADQNGPIISYYFVTYFYYIMAYLRIITYTIASNIVKHITKQPVK